MILNKKLFSQKALLGVIEYAFFGFFSNLKWIMLSFINILKIIPKSKNYKMFSYQNVLLYYFYDVFLYCLIKKGRYKYSNYVNSKPFLIGRWFHVSKFSLYPFVKNSVLTVFISWIFILSYPFISSWGDLYIEHLIVFILTLFSSKYFHQLRAQNYNIVGWIFFYPFLEAISDSNNILIYFLSIFLFHTSLTAFVIGSFFLIFSTVFFEISLKMVMINFLILIPFIIWRIFPLIKKGNIVDLFLKVLSSIGFIKSKDSNLKRSPKSFNHLIFDLFNFSTLLIFIILFFIESEVPVFLIFALFFFVVNIFLTRFSDPENIDMCIIICTIYCFHNISVTYELIFFYWFLIANPLYESLFKNKFEGKIEKPLMPVKIVDFEEKMNLFYKEIKPGAKIFFPSKDPNGIYENLLDNHNMLLSPLYFFALKNKILFHPYYFTIFYDKSNHYKYWGMDFKDIISNMKRRNFEYALIKSEKILKSDSRFKENFEVISKLDWRKIYPHPLKEINKYPIWCLLKLNIQSK
tara:strand:+ start:39 stop:1598 length:1560 start_codon:yes stop_codon:yes gene_type:complete